MIKLFCLTYAGGSAKFFQGFSDKLPENISCYSLEYAGHNTRRSEPLYKTFDEMVVDVSKLINAKIEKNDVIGIFGYSMGSLVSYEMVARGLLKVMPAWLFVAAHNAPSVSSVKEKYSVLPDEKFVRRLSIFGGLGSGFIENKRFWPIYLPLIKNDYRLLEEYDFDKKIITLGMKMCVFYSEKDTSSAEVEEWKKVSDDIEFYKFSGNHFFLKKYEDKIAKIISSKMC